MTRTLANTLLIANSPETASNAISTKRILDLMSILRARGSFTRVPRATARTFKLTAPYESTPYMTSTLRLIARISTKPTISLVSGDCNIGTLRIPLHGTLLGQFRIDFSFWRRRSSRRSSFLAICHSSIYLYNYEICLQLLFKYGFVTFICSIEIFF